MPVLTDECPISAKKEKIQLNHDCARGIHIRKYSDAKIKYALLVCCEEDGTSKMLLYDKDDSLGTKGRRFPTKSIYAGLLQKHIGKQKFDTLCHV